MDRRTDVVGSHGAARGGASRSPVRRHRERTERLRQHPTMTRAVLLAGLVVLATPLGAQTTQPRADSVPVHDTLTVASRALGEVRPVNVHTPPSYRASSAVRFPVLYMPDGGLNEDFPHVVHAV